MESKDLLVDFYKERYEEYLEDIELANRALSDSMLNIPDEDLICDIYAIPSHNHQTFYVKIFRAEAGYKILFAKSILNNPVYTEEIYMYPFVVAAQAGERRGKIVCGIKTLEEHFVDNLIDKLETLPDKYLFKMDEFVLDGVSHIIRVYEGGRIQKEVAYGQAESIPYKADDIVELQWFFSSLYLKIEQIIGCGTNGESIGCDCGKYAPGDEIDKMIDYFTFYETVPMGRRYRCVYCNVFWTRYRPGFGWRSYFRDVDDESEVATLSDAEKIDTDVTKLQLLRDAVVKMLQRVPDYSSDDLLLVEQYFAEKNGKDCVNSVDIQEDGKYTLFLAMEGKIRAKVCDRSLDDATTSIGNTILDMKRLQSNNM